MQVGDLDARLKVSEHAAAALKVSEQAKFVSPCK